MSTEYSRYYSALADYSADDPIDDRDLDGEFDAMVTALNRKVLISATAPSSPSDGDTWINTTLNPPQLEIYDLTGTKWIINHAVPPHYIKGMQLVYTDDAVVTVNAGELELQGELLTEIVDKTIDVDAATWVNGAKGASQWAYIYAYRDAANSWALAVSDEAPDLSDVSDNAAGILRYQKYGTTYYRYLGAVYLDADVDILKFYERNGTVHYDVDQTLLDNGTANQTWTNVDCTAFMPATSELLIASVYSYSTRGLTDETLFRPDGSGGTGSHRCRLKSDNSPFTAIPEIRTVAQIFEYYHSSANCHLYIYGSGYKDTR